MLQSFTNRLALCLLFAGMLNACNSMMSPAPAAMQQDVSPQNTARFKQAITALQKNELDRSARLLQQIISEAPQLPGAHINLGIIYTRQQKYIEALSAFKQAKDLAPDNPLIHNQLGLVYRKLGNFRSAESAYQQAISLDSNYSNAYLNLGILYDLYLYQLDKALVYYQKYQDLNDQADPLVSKWITDLKNRQQGQQG